MEISHRIQANCSEWNEEVEDEQSIDTAREAAISELIERIKKRAKEQKEWD